MSSRSVVTRVGLVAMALAACGTFVIADDTEQPIVDPNPDIRWVPVSEGKSAVWLTLPRQQFDFEFGKLPPSVPKPPPDEGTLETQSLSGKSIPAGVAVAASFGAPVARPGSFGLNGAGRSGVTRGSLLSALGSVSEQLGF